MLTINPDTVCFLISKARQFHAKEEVVIPEEPMSPSDDWALQVLADHIDDYTYQEVESAIDSLDIDKQVALVALMWLGRGDFELGEWEEATEAARQAWNGDTTHYLMGTPLVADYLEEGLVQHGYSCDA